MYFLVEYDDEYEYEYREDAMSGDLLALHGLCPTGFALVFPAFAGHPGQSLLSFPWRRTAVLDGA